MTFLLLLYVHFFAAQTLHIQQEIDRVAAAGGGRVTLKKGVYTTGTIILRSNVELHLEEGAIIKGSAFRKDYEGHKKAALILAVGEKNISITGKGMIDGQGRALIKDIYKRLEEGTLQDAEWKTKRPGENTRTNVIYFENCTNVAVTGVTIKDATSWVTHYERCDQVKIDSVKIESTAYWNNDGIDIVDTKNVRITNC